MFNVSRDGTVSGIAVQISDANPEFCKIADWYFHLSRHKAQTQNVWAQIAAEVAAPDHTWQVSRRPVVACLFNTSWKDFLNLTARHP